MNIQKFQDGLEQLHKLQRRKNYTDAFKLIQELLTDYPYSSELLVRQAIIIQILDNLELEFATLTEAFNSLSAAYALEPKSIEPCIEIGYFEYAVNNSSKAAIKYFSEAEAKARAYLKAALIGQIKCFIDIGEINRAKKILSEAQLLFPDESELGILEFECD